MRKNKKKYPKNPFVQIDPYALENEAPKQPEDEELVPIHTEQPRHSLAVVRIFSCLITLAVCVLVLHLLRHPGNLHSQPPVAASPSPTVSPSAAESPQPSATAPPPVESPAPSEPAPTPEGGAAYAFGDPVPKAAAVDPGYYNDTLFIGDSVLRGLKDYELLPAGATILAANGMQVNILFDKEASFSVGTTSTLAQMLTQTPNPKQIYLQIGINSLDWMLPEDYLAYFSADIDTLRESYPTQPICVISLFPVTESMGEKYPAERVREYNEGLQALCREKGLYYMNAYEFIANDQGYIPSEADLGDGIHFDFEHYEKFRDYLLEHPLPAAP